MHLCSINFAAIAMISSSIIFELLPACFSCSNIFDLLQSSLGSDDKNFVKRPETLIVVELSKFIRNLSLLLFRHFCSILKLISFPN